MTDEAAKIVVHSPYSALDGGEGKRVSLGFFGGVEIVADPSMPDDQVRVVQNGKVLHLFKIRP